MYHQDISTHALTEGDRQVDELLNEFDISTHALTEGDSVQVFFVRQDGISTHALTEGDPERAVINHLIYISTHALTEGDRKSTRKRMFRRIFQLTPSRRATMFTFAFTDDILFQLTPSRRATMESSSFFMFSSISTHALTEGDEQRSGLIILQRSFQLTPSRRATFTERRTNQCRKFQLTPSRRATIRHTLHTCTSLISTHALTEGDVNCCCCSFVFVFQLTPSRRATIIIIDC